MNEELQATNEELRTINDQLHLSSAELGQVNLHLRSILASLRAAVVVLDGELQVEIWSDKAQELWGLRSDEVLGQRFLDLDIGLPVDRLAGPIAAVLAHAASREVLLDSVNRRGRDIRCRIVCTPLGEDGSAEGVILLMEETREAAGA